MNIKKLVLGVSLAVASTGAFAGFINVGGVVWDPDAINLGNSQQDFQAHASVIEQALIGTTPGQVITGFGIFSQFNNGNPATTPGGYFCPECQLTYSFSMTLKSVTPVLGVFANFEFENLTSTWYVDHVGNAGYTAFNTSDITTAINGTEWLKLSSTSSALHPLDSTFLLTGFGSNIGTGSDAGSGNAYLNVTGGLAASNFDTNADPSGNGADILFNSSFSPFNAPAGKLTGTVDFYGASIPEPTSIALLGIGLLGFGASRARKQA